jgi:hypothetical protein
VSLGLGVFASVVLILAVYHKGFRKVLLWSGIVTVALALLGATGYFAYTRFTTWQTDRAAQKQKAALDKGIRACMTRLGTPMPGGVTTTDFFPAAYFDNLTACQAYPDMDIAPPPGFVPDSLPAGYMIDLKGKVSPIPPGAIISSAKKDAAPFDLSAGFVPKKETRRILKANVVCDVVVYDRDKFAAGDPEAIDSLHTGDTVEYVGHTTVSDEDIIRVHGRKGYVNSCIEVKP